MVDPRCRLITYICSPAFDLRWRRDGLRKEVAQVEDTHLFRCGFGACPRKPPEHIIGEHYAADETMMTGRLQLSNRLRLTSAGRVERYARAARCT